MISFSKLCVYSGFIIEYIKDYPLLFPNSNTEWYFNFVHNITSAPCVRAHPDEFPYVENARIIILMTFIETLRKTFSQNALY